VAIDVDEVVVGADGHIYVAPVGTTAPADIAAAWGAGWIDLGYATEDGVTFTESRTITDLMAWQSFYPVRRVVTAKNTTVAFVLQQWNEDTVKLAFGGGTVTTTAGPPAHYLYTPPSAETIDERAVGVEWEDGTKIYRLIIPRAVVTDDVATQIVRADTAQLPITMGVIGEAGVSPWILRTNDPAWAAA
jgi:hypothetical protein